MNTSKILSGIITIICVIGILSFISLVDKQSPPHHNSIDATLSQYSDSHITLNAVVADLQFKNIAFDNPPPGKSSIFPNQIAAAVRAVKLLTSPAGKVGAGEHGSWVWTPIMEMTPEYMDLIIAGAKDSGINTIYLSVDSYLDIFTMEKGTERENQKEAFGDKLEYFISNAANQGIAVDAEAGWRNWAEGENVYKAYAIANYVKNFNATSQNKFRGFQYDIEPYLLDSYAKNKSSQISALKNFVTLIDQTQYFLGTSTLHFSVVVPDFYDAKDKATPKFSYNGSNDYTFKHLLNVLEKRPDSSIIIMSYRNFADGDDGTIEISNNEMQTAYSGSYKTKIIIAQETSNVSPIYITFYDTSQKYFGRQIESINKAFSPYPNFGGIAIHYANSYLALK